MLHCYYFCSIRIFHNEMLRLLVFAIINVLIFWDYCFNCSISYFINYSIDCFSINLFMDFFLHFIIRNYIYFQLMTLSFSKVYLAFLFMRLAKKQLMFQTPIKLIRDYQMNALSIGELKHLKILYFLKMHPLVQTFSFHKKLQLSPLEK